MLFSNRLRWLRNRYGYSQAALAEELSLSRMTYTQYESGHREPNLETLLHLSKIFHVSTDFLLGVSDLSHMPELSPQESYLISQFDRLTDERRHHVFQVLQHELGQQLLSDAFVHNEICSTSNQPNPADLSSKP